MVQAPCPFCGLEGGFHDHSDKESKHGQHEVPRELLLEPGWAKEAHEKLKRELAAKVEVVETAALLAEVLTLAEEEVSARLSDEELDKRRKQIEALAVMTDEEGAPDRSLDAPSTGI